MQRQRRNALQDPTEVLQAAIIMSLPDHPNGRLQLHHGGILLEPVNSQTIANHHLSNTLPSSGRPNIDETKIPPRALVFEAATIPHRIQCRVHRIYGEDRLFPDYELHLEGDATSGRTTSFLLAARRHRHLFHTKYTISVNSIESGQFEKGIIAKIKSNWAGTRFEIYDAQKMPGREGRCTQAVVLYETNVLGLKGPRRMTILLPGMTDDGVIRTLPYDRRHCRLEQLYHNNQKRVQSGEGGGERGKKQILALHNKYPHWNEDTQSYVLNFNNRVSQASIKNFQVAPSFDLTYIVLQFGRTGPDTFSMDFQYPLSAIQAFGITLTEFDPKLLCE